MVKAVDRTGLRYGRLLVLRADKPRRSGGQSIKFWWVRCDCGTEKSVRGTSLSSGQIQSCGCQRRDNGRANAVDILGQRFGRWTVLAKAESKDNSAMWRCRCDCGAERVVAGHYLFNGESQSCGCYREEMHGQTNFRHGDARASGLSLTYSSWKAMKNRCNNEKSPSYPDYGGRGITICDRWQSYINFLADMGKRPSPQHSLDRTDVNGHYCPENCRWATKREQSANKRSNCLYTHDGETLPLAEWARRFSVRPATILGRLAREWSLGDALTKPVGKYNKNGSRGGIRAIWTGIKDRCLNPRSHLYSKYGGKGITICQEWVDSLEAFANHVGPRPSSQHSIDRIDNSKGYEPGNVRWATPREQSANRHCTKTLTLDGETLTYSEWAGRLGVPAWLLRARHRMGWTDVQILATPHKPRTVKKQQESLS